MTALLLTSLASTQIFADEPEHTTHPAVTGKVSTASASASSTEDFKGAPHPEKFTAGLLSGVGIIDSSAGFVLLPNFAFKIVEPGFAPDINNSVFFETELGPLFIKGTSALQYSLHLRWDFQKDNQWTLFAMGGFGGDVTGEALGSRWIFLPRFGIGAFYDFDTHLSARFEVSHEFTGVGVSYRF